MVKTAVEEVGVLLTSATVGMTATVLVLNVTNPVGGLVVGVVEVTLNVKVTLLPFVDGLSEEMMVAVVAAGVMLADKSVGWERL